jgi:hypothetical protein
VKVAHHKTGTKAFSRDIAHKKEEAVADVEDIRVVSADQSRRLMELMAMPAFETSTPPLQTRSLNTRCELEVVFQVLFFVRRKVVQPEI